MKLWKRDTENWTVREVEGEPWPGYDSEGHKCYENTHFANETDAWKSLESEARAGLSLATRSLIQARADVTKREKECADAAIAVATVIQTMPDNAKVSGAGTASAGLPGYAGDGNGERND